MAPVPAFRLRCAADWLRSGGVIAHPTEAVWGLACLPRFEEAVARLLSLKQRDPAKGLILVARSERYFAPLLQALPDEVRERLRSAWPGPSTFIVPDPLGWTPKWVRGAHNNVAIRVSDHPLTAALSAAVKGPIVSTSANPASAAPARTALRARRYFGEALDCYLSGPTGGAGRPSRIVDALSGEVIRE